MKKISVKIESPTIIHNFVMLANTTEEAKLITESFGYNVTSVREVPSYEGIIRNPKDFK